MKYLQQLLAEAGYYTGEIDGKFGTGTENAVREFQKRNMLQVDGKAGQQTLLRLTRGIVITPSPAPETTAALEELPTPDPIDPPLPDDPNLLSAPDTQDSLIPPEDSDTSTADITEPDTPPEGDTLPDESNPPQDDAPIQQDSEAII